MEDEQTFAGYLEHIKMCELISDVYSWTQK